MLLSFSVSNFRSIGERQTLSMVATKLTGDHEAFDVKVPSAGGGVLPCAVIYGPNASGKSNLLMAMNRMIDLVQTSHASRRLGGKLPFSPFVLDSEWNSSPTSLDISFMRDGVRYDYGFSYNKDTFMSEYLHSYPEGRRRRLFERSGQDFHFGSTLTRAKVPGIGLKTLSELVRPDALLVSVAIQHNDEELKPVIDFMSGIYSQMHLHFAQKFFSSSFEEGEVDARAVKFLELIGTGIIGYEVNRTDIDPNQRKLLLGVMKVVSEQAEGAEDSDSVNEEAFFPQEMKEVRTRLAHRKSDGGSVFFNIEQESLGTRRLLQMLNNVFKVLDNGHLAIIDELDASLHTHAVSAVLQLFSDPVLNKNKAQIIATTHDTNLLSSGGLRRDEIWFVEKTRGGASEYFALSEFSTRKDEALERHYLEGRYGAVPSKFGASHFLPSHDGVNSESAS